MVRSRRADEFGVTEKNVLSWVEWGSRRDVIVLGPRHWKLGRASAWKKLGLAWEPERERTGAWSLRTRTRCCWVLNKYMVPGYHIAILYIYHTDKQFRIQILMLLNKTMASRYCLADGKAHLDIA